MARCESCGRPMGRKAGKVCSRCERAIARMSQRISTRPATDKAACTVRIAGREYEFPSAYDADEFATISSRIRASWRGTHSELLNVLHRLCWGMDGTPPLPF